MHVCLKVYHIFSIYFHILSIGIKNIFCWYWYQEFFIGIKNNIVFKFYWYQELRTCLQSFILCFGIKSNIVFKEHVYVQIDIKSMFVSFVIFYHWYQEHLLLVSRACLFHWYQISYLCIFILSIHDIFLVFITMHELRGSFYEA